MWGVRAQAGVRSVGTWIEGVHPVELCEGHNEYSSCPLPERGSGEDASVADDRLYPSAWERVKKGGEYGVRKELTHVPSGRLLLIRIIGLGWEVDVWIVWCLVPGIAICVGIHVMCERESGMRRGG